MVKHEIRVLDLFSGIGGFALGLKRAGGFRTVAYCEIEPYCQQVLLSRMRDGSLDSAPICGDVRRLAGEPWAGRVELVCGGFPCQDVSLAGKCEGIDGERSGLWSEIARLVREIRPRYVIVENVPGLLYGGFGRVLGDLAESGYDAEWDCISASAFGAPHRRDRVWIVAYSGQQHGNRDTARYLGQSAAFKGCKGGCWSAENDHGHIPAMVPDLLRRSADDWWLSQSRMARSANGLPHQVDRLATLGNTVVPNVVEWIGRRIRNYDLS